MSPALPFVARTHVSKHEPIGVIDIGSNSIRMVIYRRYGRYPLPLFNERVTVKLGEGLDQNEMLSPDKIALALSALRRFSHIMNAMSLECTIVVATAAVRRAKNAAVFTAPAEEIIGVPITVLPAQDEARLVTLGLTANMPHVSGLVADLGGGSLELVLVKEGQVQKSTSLNMGHLSTRTESEIATLLCAVDWLGDAAGVTLYGIGGSFRALGSAYVKRSNYPLFLLHGLELNVPIVLDILTSLQGDEPDLQGIPAGRRDSIGMAADIMAALIRRSGVSQLAISGTSIRDGLVADMDTGFSPKKDPLLSACKEIANHSQRFDGLNDVLIDCLSPIASLLDIPDPQRLLKAACLLSDISWNEPSELRGAVATDRILALPLFSLSHKERAWLAKVVYHRYIGVKENKPTLPVFNRLLTPAESKGALALGVGLRFALIYCAGIPDYLSAIQFKVTDETIYYDVAAHGLPLFDEHSERRLRVFAKACNRTLKRLQ
jgi:exopolyphosphatase/guanosine-5'-triphosphate,3'-diphosphate pyrophosphatase